MTIGPRRPAYYIGVLSIGFVFGGFLSALLERFLPPGPATEFLTWKVVPTVGPFHVDLLLFSATLGPVAVNVSLLALVGVGLAYMIARSLF